MRSLFNASLSALAISLLAACGGGSSKSDSDIVADGKCSNANLHSFWYDTLEYEYLWLDELKQPNKSFANYTSSNDMLNDVLPLRDRFSGVVATDEWNSVISGESFGMGVEFGPVDNELIIYQVYKNSPAEQAGLKRGDKITKIENTSATTIIDWLTYPYDYNAFYDLFGPDTKGYEIDLQIELPDGTQQSVIVAKDEIKINTVAYYGVTTTNQGKIGYLSFPTGFFTDSGKEIDTAFAYFNQQQPDYFILDLRDNGGGLLSVAARLSLYLAGDKMDQETFLRITHNQNLASWDADFTPRDLITTDNASSYGQILQNSLNLNNLIVLTNEGSASASESVINGLEPYMDVTLIGERTYGKPVGFYANDGSYDYKAQKEVGYEICNETLLALNFQTENANGFADYLDGLDVDCRVTNDYPAGDWNELNDRTQRAALQYIANGECPFGTATKGISDKPETKLFRAINLPGMILNK